MQGPARLLRVREDRSLQLCGTAEGRGSVGSVSAAHTEFWFPKGVRSKQSHLVVMDSSEACSEPAWPAVERRSGSGPVGGGQTC